MVDIVASDFLTITFNGVKSAGLNIRSLIFVLLTVMILSAVSEKVVVRRWGRGGGVGNSESAS